MRWYWPIGACVAAAGIWDFAVGEAKAELSHSFQVGATIQSGCLIEGPSASASNFGTLDFGQASAQSTGTRSATLANAAAIKLRCTPQTILSMMIDAGQHADSGIRYLQRGSDTGSRIAYQLCADTGCAQPISAFQPVTVAITTANADDVRLPIYGHLTLPGNLPAGIYADTLTLVLSW